MSLRLGDMPGRFFCAYIIVYILLILIYTLDFI